MIKMVLLKKEALFLFACFVLIKADFLVTVNFTHYTNPSGLCAECNTTLDSTPLDQIVPVCCDQQPFTTDSCNHTGNATCDTRFRWIIRDFGDIISTRPPSGEELYNYSPCSNNHTIITPYECPVSRKSFNFEQGDQAFLGKPNPTPVISSKPWMGRFQFYIEAVESTLPNIIDSFVINFDNLQLGADFTEEMTFTGYHNISQMSMSFKVGCAPNYYDLSCTTYCVDTSNRSSCEAINNRSVCRNAVMEELEPPSDTPDPCEAAPCKNGGTCSTRPGDYLCSCVSGFAGLNCTDSMQLEDSTIKTDSLIILGIVLEVTLSALLIMLVIIGLVCFKCKNRPSGTLKQPDPIRVATINKTASTDDNIQLQQNLLYEVILTGEQGADGDQTNNEGLGPIIQTNSTPDDDDYVSM